MLTFAPLFTINVPLIAPLTSFKPEDRASSVFSVIYVITAKRPIGVVTDLFRLLESSAALCFQQISAIFTRTGVLRLPDNR